MSTKIYNGFKFKTNDMISVLHYLMDLREPAKERIKESMKQNVARVYTEFCDTKCIGKEDFQLYRNNSWNPIKDLDELRNFIIAEYKIVKSSKENNMNNFDDYGYEIMVYPKIGIVDQEILGVPFYNARCFDKLLESKKWYKSYGYWDNTDKPRHVTKEAWKQREQDWDEVFKDTNTFSETGFRYDLTNNWESVIWSVLS